MRFYYKCIFLGLIQFFVIFSAFSLLDDESYVEESAAIPASRLSAAKFKEGDFKTYDQLSRQHFGHMFSGLPEKPLPMEEIPLFSVKSPDGGISYTILGSDHGHPFFLSPEEIGAYIKRSDHVYVESSYVSRFTHPGAEEASADEKYSVKTYACGCMMEWLQHFGADQLCLDQLYDLMCCNDIMFGIDATIEVLTLSLGKPLRYLDMPFNVCDVSLKINRTYLERESISCAESAEMLTLLDRDPRAFKLKTIEEEARGLKETETYEAPSLQLEKLSSLEKDEDYRLMQTEKRNTRWVRILDQEIPELGGNVFVCVGLNHLPGLFRQCLERKYTIEHIATAKMFSLEDL